MRLCALVVAAALLASGPAVATSLRGPADVASLTAAADAVVHARVAQVKSGWAGGSRSSGRIVTTVTLEPLEVWKGAPAVTLLTVLVPGGAADELAQNVDGVAAFREGEVVVVFLRQIDRRADLFEVHRWSLGKFSVSAAPAGARVRRERAGLECVGCSAAERDELSLSELRAAVDQALQKGRGSP